MEALNIEQLSPDLAPNSTWGLQLKLLRRCLYARLKKLLDGQLGCGSATKKNKLGQRKARTLCFCHSDELESSVESREARGLDQNNVVANNGMTNTLNFFETIFPELCWSDRTARCTNRPRTRSCLSARLSRIVARHFDPPLRVKIIRRTTSWAMCSLLVY